MAASTAGDPRVPFARCRGGMVQVGRVSEGDIVATEEQRWQPHYRRRFRLSSWPARAPRSLVLPSEVPAIVARSRQTNRMERAYYAARKSCARVARRSL